MRCLIEHCNGWGKQKGYKTANKKIKILCYADDTVTTSEYAKFTKHQKTENKNIHSENEMLPTSLVI